jgi:hypothetical protein
MGIDRIVAVSRKPKEFFTGNTGALKEGKVGNESG